ncbi:MAG: hypothetical protein JWQ25_1477 [Daejeonella sp.]|nr:hypothetical protein [Daejeonella sp.]
MKHFKLLSSSSILSFGIASLCLFGLSSCGTVANLVTGGKRPSFIVNSPADVVIKLDGTPLDLSSELFTSSVNIGATATTNFSTAAVNLPYKKAITLEISSPSTGRTGTLELKPKGSGPIFWGNLIFAPIVGHIIDGVTGNNKTLRPKYIDVTSVLNKVPFKDWPSQGQLKRREKDLANGK